MTIIYSHKKLPRDREPSDFYPTPLGLCVAALQCHPIVHYSCLDVGAGDGVWGEAFQQVYGRDLSYLIGIDVREDAKGKPYYDEWVLQDFMSYEKKQDFIFGNIPFRFANEFIAHSLELLNPGGNILFLLRSAISESKKRYGMFYNNGYKPSYEYQSVRRISFTGNKKSDNTAYSIFIWEQKKEERETIKRWLNWDYDNPLSQL